MPTTELRTPPPTFTRTSEAIADVEAFLDACQADLLPPDEVTGRLVRAGWRDADAAVVVQRYRKRYDEHPLGYAGFLFSIGFGALATGSVGHLLLAMIDGQDPSRQALALWLTVLLIAIPFAAWSWSWVERVDRSDPVAAWSGPRQALSTTLLWCCGLVGGARLVAYVYTVSSVVAGASDGNLAIGFANVAVTAGITVPLGIWAFRFRHRFDVSRRSSVVA